MIEREDTPDLPQDAPLRIRLWWRLWRGWAHLGRCLQYSIVAILAAIVASTPAAAAGFLVGVFALGPLLEQFDPNAVGVYPQYIHFGIVNGALGWLAGFLLLASSGLRRVSPAVGGGDLDNQEASPTPSGLGNSKRSSAWTAVSPRSMGAPFWRGWRKALAILSILIALAWVTRPMRSGHALAYVDHRVIELQQILGNQIATGRRSNTVFEAVFVAVAEYNAAMGNPSMLEIPQSGLPKLKFADHVLFSIVWADHPEGRESLFSIGAFGIVWTLAP